MQLCLYTETDANYFLQNSFETIKFNIVLPLNMPHSLFFDQDKKKMLLRTGKISYPHSVDDVLFRTLSGITFFFLCGTQDEFLNVSVAFNI